MTHDFGIRACSTARSSPVLNPKRANSEVRERRELHHCKQIYYKSTMFNCFRTLMPGPRPMWAHGFGYATAYRLYCIPSVNYSNTDIMKMKLPNGCHTRLNYTANMYTAVLLKDHYCKRSETGIDCCQVSAISLHLILQSCRPDSFESLHGSQDY